MMCTLRRPVHCNWNYYPTIAPFYHIRENERVKYATLLHCRTGQKYGPKAERKDGRTKLYFISGIINPLFDGLTNNTSGHSAHCTRKISARIIYQTIE